MNRKSFLKKGLVGIGAFVAIPAITGSCSADKNDDPNIEETGECSVSPTETKGPFPIKTPSELVQANIVSDRSGVAMIVTLTVQEKNNDCLPMHGVYVDIWHCDADGDYSEYGGTQMQSTNYTDVHFLRGRQLTDSNGKVSFITIYPGWYQGRAPHIHVEVLDASEGSLLITQIAFPETVSSSVYTSSLYNGVADTSNDTDNVFSDSLDENMADSVTGNVTDGYTLLKTIVV